MKLTLPKGILAALLACCSYASAQDLGGMFENPENGGATTEGDYLYISGNVEIWKDYLYESNGLSVGTKDGTGTLNIQRPWMGEEPAPTVKTSTSLFIGGTGYNHEAPPANAANDGTVYVHEGATLEVGAGTDDHTASQLNVGWGQLSEDQKGKGSMEVAGKVISNYALNVGLSESSHGTLLVHSGGEVQVRSGDNITSIGDSELQIATGKDSTGEVTVTGEGSTLSVAAKETGKANSYIGVQGDATLAVADGASVNLAAQGTAGTYMGHEAGGSATVTVDGAGSELTMGTAIVGNKGNAELTASNGAAVTVLNNLQVAYEESGTGSVSITGGATMKVDGDAVVNSGGSMVIDGASMVVEGTYYNLGTTTATLQAGNTFSAGAYINYGDSTITASEGAVCNFTDLQMLSGTMTFAGKGKFVLGGQSSSGGGADTSSTALGTTFSVSSAPDSGDGGGTGGSETAEAVTTTLDISGLSEENFTLDTTHSITLQFSDELLADVAAGSYKEYSLLLIKGYDGFTLGADALAVMLSNTDYQFGSPVAVMALTLMSDEVSAYTIGDDARYEMRGSDLYWVGSVVHTLPIPEPATATLSLLALAALAARRRRK